MFKSKTAKKKDRLDDSSVSNSRLVIHLKETASTQPCGFLPLPLSLVSGYISFYPESQNPICEGIPLRTSEHIELTRSKLQVVRSP